MSTLLYHSHIKLNDMLLLTRGGGPKQNHLCGAVECLSLDLGEVFIPVEFLFIHSPIVTSSLSPCFQCDSETSSSSNGHLLEIQNARPRPDTMNQKHCGQRHPKHMPISL